MLLIINMSVRPVTESEKRQAYGQPWTGFLMAMGASQGLLTHLKYHGTSVHHSWAPNGFARFTLPVFVLGGAALGFTLGVHAFGDAELRRLAE